MEHLTMCLLKEIKRNNFEFSLCCQGTKIKILAGDYYLVIHVGGTWHICPVKGDSDA